MGRVFAREMLQEEAMAYNEVWAPVRHDGVRWRDRRRDRPGDADDLDAFESANRPQIAVVIPCFRVRSTIADVIDRIGAEVTTIIVVDDGCPESTGCHVEATCADPRVTVVRSAVNMGVGGAM